MLKLSFWLAILVCLAGCVTMKTHKFQVINAYGLGYMDGQKDCQDKIIDHYEFLFKDRIRGDQAE